MLDLDLSQIMDGKNYAVHCASKKDAIEFVSFMKQRYPGRTKFWSDDEHNWDFYFEDTVYFPHFELSDGVMTYGTLNGYSVRGSIIVPFCDLVKSHEFSIEMSDRLVDDLLGI